MKMPSKTTVSRIAIALVLLGAGANIGAFAEQRRLGKELSVSDNTWQRGDIRGLAVLGDLALLDRVVWIALQDSTFATARKDAGMVLVSTLVTADEANVPLRGFSGHWPDEPTMRDAARAGCANPNRAEEPQCRKVSAALHEVWTYPTVERHDDQVAVTFPNMEATTCAEVLQGLPALLYRFHETTVGVGQSAPMPVREPISAAAAYSACESGGAVTIAFMKASRSGQGKI